MIVERRFGRITVNQIDGKAMFWMGYCVRDEQKGEKNYKN